MEVRFAYFYVVPSTGVWRDFIIASITDASPSRCSMVCQYELRGTPPRPCSYWYHEFSSCYIGNIDATSSILGATPGDNREVYVHKGDKGQR